MDKYLALKTTIKSNGWSVELFENEVGARGYCCKYVWCYLKNLGFNNTLIRNNIKNLVSLPWNALFLSGLLEITKNGLLPLSHANSVLQVLRVMPLLWNRITSESNYLFHML